MPTDAPESLRAFQDVRAALAALTEGRLELKQFEMLVAHALTQEAGIKGAVSQLLSAALQSGALGAATLARVGLDEPGEQTRPRAADSEATRANQARAHTRAVKPQEAGQWSAPVQPGQLLGNRYRLERELGSGGMGSVYLARDEEVVGEMFAIKLLKPEIRDFPESVALLREEVRKTRSLQHPNIVGVYSVNSDHGEVYVLMEYLQGKSLLNLLQEDFGRGMPMERAWPLISDMCTALAYAHDHNVIHSDLKPANVFVTTSGRAKLLDFGIARAARGRSASIDPGAIGALTPAYASCEMLLGQEPDERDDVYGLGCVIYEMLSGKHPFERRSSVEARDAGMRMPPIATLSRAQNDGLARALSFERATRTASVEAVMASLIDRPAATRRPIGAFVIAAVSILVAGAALAFWLWGRPGTSDRPRNTLAHARSLAQRARALSVDRSDRPLQEGLRLLAEAEKQAAAGGASEGTPTLTQAITYLSAANMGGRRFARLGSSPDEVALAVNLCKRKSNSCPESAFAGESPHMAVLAPFELDRSGVTNKEFEAFAQAAGYKTLAEMNNGLFVPDASGAEVFQRGLSWKSLRGTDGESGDADAYPVRGIDLESAKAYCGWRGRRLPSEDEWEFVARGVDHRLFSWGNDPNGDPAHRLLPVDQQAASGRFGNHGLGGSLWEWTLSADATTGVLRGASWRETDLVRQRLATRRPEDPQRSYADAGFRCAKSTDSWPEGS